MRKQGFILLIILPLILLMCMAGGYLFIYKSGEIYNVRRQIASMKAFWVAEAGVNMAIFQLKKNYNDLSPIGLTLLAGKGEYSATITSSDDGGRVIMACGFVPSAASTSKAERVVEVGVVKFTPPGFYDNAIYSAGDVDIGNNCAVNGDVFSGGDVIGPVNGDKTQNDPDLHNNGLPLLSFDELQQKSIDQGWYDPDTGETTFPDSFWNVEPTSPEDPGVPNVVFVNGDFSLVGGHQVVQGFIVVGGNTIYNAEIGGNASIVGCLYTRGNVWLHGGGGNTINVNGGIWSGGTVTIVGNEQINFDPPEGSGPTYMNAIEALGINADIQIASWREI